jgi:hypothetical protein
MIVSVADSKKLAGKEPESFRVVREAGYRRPADYLYNSCLRSLDNLHLTARFMSILNGSKTLVPVFSATQLADLLQISYQAFWHLQKQGLVPDPILLTTIGKRKLAVYHIDEARAIITEIGKHKLVFQYYRKEHVYTRQRLFDRVTTIRQQWSNNQWPDSRKNPLPQKPVPQKKRALPPALLKKMSLKWKKSRLSS